MSGCSTVFFDRQVPTEVGALRSMQACLDLDVRHASLIIVPNGKLSDATVNNLGTRRFFFTKTKLPICYSTPVGQIEKFIMGLRDLIRKIPNAMPEKSNVAVTSLGPDKIEV